MQKFAFLVHLRSYRDDLGTLATPLGWLPESFYRFALNNRPLPPIIWSDVSLTPGSTEPEGHIIMLPYSGSQLLEQRKQMMPRIEQAMKLAADKGARLLGLGALCSSITLGGKLVANNPHLSVTNGNAFTAVITHARIARLIENYPNRRPVVALVGASGSVGTLVSQLLARHNPEADYLLVARQGRRLKDLAAEMNAIDTTVLPQVSKHINDIRQADIVVLTTSSADCLLQAHQLKRNAVVLDDTQPRNTHPSLLVERPDVTVIDGGLVSVTHLKTSKVALGLPPGISYACLAETMLLAQAGYDCDFSVGNPTLSQAEFISQLAHRFTHLGFGLAPDHSFGQLLVHQPAQLETCSADYAPCF